MSSLFKLLIKIAAIIASFFFQIGDKQSSQTIQCNLQSVTVSAGQIGVPS